MSKKIKTKDILQFCAISTVTAAATAILAWSFYQCIADWDRPVYDENKINNARTELNKARQEYYDQLNQTYKIANDITQKRAAKSLGYCTMNEFYASKPNKSDIDSVENKIEDETHELFNELFLTLPNLKTAGDNLHLHEKQVKKMEQDSISAKKHDAKPTAENFARNWRQIKQRIYKKTR